ncbi:hypothetical protein ADK82_24975 [Streptomyces sp. NRRL S-4]|nr:hypothetical protein ADK82_24975 [Streptomyces sp. NRRL S-4]
MRHRITRIFELLMRRPVPGPRRRPSPCTRPHGITLRCTGERPPRGEDSPLVRPYYVAYEREREAHRLAELRRRRALVVIPCGREAAA